MFVVDVTIVLFACFFFLLEKYEKFSYHRCIALILSMRSVLIVCVPISYKRIVLTFLVVE